MLADVLTVVWKEWHEMLGQRWVFWGMISQAATFGVFIALNQGLAFIQSPVSLSYWIWLPAIMVMTVIADAIAGERERHTLETLLASRLPDRAILLGKVGASVLYALFITLAAVLFGLFVVNLRFWEGRPLLFTPGLALLGGGLSLLMAFLVANAGVLISLRATSVRQAQLIMATIFVPITIIPASLLLVLPASYRGILVGEAGAELRAQLYRFAAFGVILLLLLDLVLLVLAMHRFTRAQLAVD